jgi:hypothetical protein
VNTDRFKTCTTCSKPWKTLKDFLADPELALAGYQAAFEDLEGGLFLFNHLYDNCGTTLAVTVKKFTVLSSRPILARSGKRPSGCSGFCAHPDELSPCPVACECGWVREIMQIIRNWKKQAA